MVIRHLLEVLPWLNFTPDTQQVQAERFSFFVFANQVNKFRFSLFSYFFFFEKERERVLLNLDREKEKRKKTLAGKFDQMCVLVCWLRPLFFH